METGATSAMGHHRRIVSWEEGLTRRTRELPKQTQPPARTPRTRRQWNVEEAGGLQGETEKGNGKNRLLRRSPVLCQIPKFGWHWLLVSQ
ncbi:hypothetical protein Pan216_26200 [Planctomycetes bacterium Pan216]|uniref:Uncharacterized protein n=1 Tax=Kolteria novifilia TaxID=2527975 RepID=A0A518B499_9BACT|nr:hypothetical protein Pan216_26200 [Planctomycetes bacterium Pan216]